MRVEIFDTLCNKMQLLHNVAAESAAKEKKSKQIIDKTLQQCDQRLGFSLVGFSRRERSSVGGCIESSLAWFCGYRKRF